jgi:hypothetical protein
VFDGISVPVQSLQIIPSAAALLGRCRAPSSDAMRSSKTRALMAAYFRARTSSLYGWRCSLNPEREYGKGILTCRTSKRFKVYQESVDKSD